MVCKINSSKSNAMRTAGMLQVDLNVDGVPTKVKIHLVYFVQKINMCQDLLSEMKRRRAAGWRKLYDSFTY